MLRWRGPGPGALTSSSGSAFSPPMLIVSVTPSTLASRMSPAGTQWSWPPKMPRWIITYSRAFVFGLTTIWLILPPLPSVQRAALPSTIVCDIDAPPSRIFLPYARTGSEGSWHSIMRVLVPTPHSQTNQPERGPAHVSYPAWGVDKQTLDCPDTCPRPDLCTNH